MTIPKIFLISLFVNDLIGIFGEHVKIGNYSGFSSQNCGIGKKSWLLEDKTFEWHSRRIRSTRIYKGRDALPGEFPFVVGIKFEDDDNFSCTGSIINSNWILTAAHCFEKETDICKVYVGFTKFPPTDAKYYSCDRIVIHSKFFQNKTDFYNDIAMIFLKESIVFVERQHYFKSNTICLPKEDILNTDYEFAVFSGWGCLKRNRDNMRHLQATTFTIFSIDSCPETEHIDDIIITDVHPNKARIMEGDSGGPLIQYVNGRAIIIGILSNEALDNHYTNCGKGSCVYTRVSKYINFIRDTINKFCQ